MHTVKDARLFAARTLLVDTGHAFVLLDSRVSYATSAWLDSEDSIAAKMPLSVETTRVTTTANVYPMGHARATKSDGLVLDATSLTPRVDKAGVPDEVDAKVLCSVFATRGTSDKHANGIKPRVLDSVAPVAASVWLKHTDAHARLDFTCIRTAVSLIALVVEVGPLTLVCVLLARTTDRTANR
jgi:hypothetical protein